MGQEDTWNTQATIEALPAHVLFRHETLEAGDAAVLPLVMLEIQRIA